MKPPARRPAAKFFLTLTVAVLFLAVVLKISQTVHQPESKAALALNKPAPVQTNAPAVQLTAPGVQNFGTPIASAPTSVRKNPFAVAQAGTNYDWTAEDARQPSVIAQLAHNDLEYDRMMDENSRIFRRQLVYHKSAFSLAAQAARMGQAVLQLTLPGLDGHELNVDVLKTEFEAGGDRGNFSGHLAGRESSLVTVAFIGGREAFTVSSPEDNLFLQGEPREPGEIIIKKINPDLYGGTFGDNDAVVQTGNK